MRYDRARGSLDRHATYISAAYVAGRPIASASGLQFRLAAATVRRTAAKPSGQQR
jgi:hypothetical protein